MTCVALPLALMGVNVANTAWLLVVKISDQPAWHVTDRSQVLQSYSMFFRKGLPFLYVLSGWDCCWFLIPRIKRTHPSRQWHAGCGKQFLGFLNSVDSFKKHLKKFFKCSETFLDDRLFMYVRIYVSMYSNCIHIHICVFISFCHLLFTASCSVKHFDFGFLSVE